MKSNTRLIISLSIAITSLILLLYFAVGPAVYKIYTLGKTNETEVAYRDNYKLHTTPLSQTVVDDLCVKLELKNTSEQCTPGAVVYAPELFDEVKTYFKHLPRQDKTYDVVQGKLSAYLVFCGHPDFEGYFRCRYDFRGDNKYPIFFYFDRQGFCREIIANTGGDS